MDDTTTTKPEITRKEVSWHATCAAIRARREAAAAGIDPEARLALAHGAGGSAMPLVSLGVLWAVEASERYLGELCGESLYADQALMCHTLLHGEEVLLALLAGDIDTVRVGMVETALEIGAARSLELNRWFPAEMRRLKHLAGGLADASPKKD